MSTAFERVEIVLARERAESVAPALASPSIEARVRAQVRLHGRDAGEDRSAQWLCAQWRSGGVTTLAHVHEPWPHVHFPRVLDELAVAFDGVRPTVALTADQLAWFARRAPTTFARLARETDVVQRDPCFVAAASADSVTFAWRPSGPVRVEPRAAPLFAAAHALAHGRVGAQDGVAQDALELVRDVLLAIHVHDRLPRTVEWVAAQGALRRRDDTSGARVVLRDAATLDVTPHTGATPLSLDVAPPIDTPRAVTAAVVEWLCAARVARSGTLFVDSSGLHARTVG